MLDLRNKIASAREQRGFTLVEVTIILLVLVILSTIMLPQLGNFNRLARFVKVKEDLGAICATMKKFLDEVMEQGPFANPNGTGTASDPVGLLVGPGAAPSAVLVATDCSVGNWDNALSTVTATTNLTCSTDIGGATPTTFLTDDLRNHLQINQPLAGGATSSLYKNQLDTASVGAFFGWRGPYFDDITDDPWGGRYSVNTFGLHSNINGNTFSTAVVCISFGPNKSAETNINMPAPTGFVIGGDDEAVVLSSMGPF